MSAWLEHLPILPVAIPLTAAAAMLLSAEPHRTTRTIIALVGALANLAAVVMLAYMAAGGMAAVWPEGIAVYRLGNWQAPFGIVLVVDRLSAVMLVLNAVLALASLVYALARWKRMGFYFHPLFQFLIMGVNGAFLTGDLFNLFVFVEILLAASYGLLLHGMGAARVKASVHYIALNLAGSFVFLIGVALIYGSSGTLNMADLAVRVHGLDAAERSLFEAGAAILGVAFLIKAGAWPLNFWLPSAYSAAAAPVGAFFSILTKVGFYALLRLGSLLSGSSAEGAPIPFDGDWLFGIGILTLTLGSAGMLMAQQPQRLTAYSVIVSSGTLLAALGVGMAGMKGAAVFYLVNSVLATGAFFMLSEMIERTGQAGGTDLDAALESYAVDFEEPLDPTEPDEVIGIVIPAAMAFLGMSFVLCALLVAGLPPLSGFVAKFLILSAALGDGPLEAMPAIVWALWVAILGSSFIGIIALGRMGIRLFWSLEEIAAPRLHLVEAAPVALLLLLSVALTAGAGPVTGYLSLAEAALAAPQTYIDAVLGLSKSSPLSSLSSLPIAPEGIDP